MGDETLIDWLLAHGGPTIRYRTLTELRADATPAEVEQSRDALWQDPTVRAWLARLHGSVAANALHGSRPTALENVLGKLSQLGCGAGMPELDRGVAPFLEWLAGPAAESTFTFYPLLTASMLALAGYSGETAVAAELERRLRTLYEFTSTGRYDIYVERKKYRGIPAGFMDTPLVDPALYAGGDLVMPYIYDLYALACHPERNGSRAARAQIDAVLGYVLDPRYQALIEGFGLMRADHNRYYAIGWSAHLTGFGKEGFPGRWPARLVQQMVLMAHFAAARSHPWFRAGLEHLESFRTNAGRYVFPRTYLPERTEGYWVTGAYNGLGENRRNKLAIEIESTFTIALLRRLSTESLTPDGE
ncbi:MAG: hypothetical protein ACYCYF_10420 [Anaerolineae bacterium]